MDRTSLPEDVLQAMRLPILQTLHVHGAMSVDELVERPVELLQVPLNRQEIVELLDDARRHELVTTLDHERRPDGSEIDTPEWALTERGRDSLHGVAGWLARLGPRLAGVVGVFVPLGAAIGLGSALDELDVSPLFLVGVVFGVALFAYVTLALLRTHLRGAYPERVAAHWPRLEEQHPAAHELLVRESAFWARAPLHGAVLLALYAGALGASDARFESIARVLALVASVVVVARLSRLWNPVVAAREALEAARAPQPRTAPAGGTPAAPPQGSRPGSGP